MSEDKSGSAGHVEDLSVLARRGTLSSADERALTSALQASATLATAHQLGLDFDEVASVQPGDEALIAEVAARTVTRARPAGSARFRLRALLLAATLALAGSATAYWKLGRAPGNVAVGTRLRPMPTSTRETRARPGEPPTATLTAPQPVAELAPAASAPAVVSSDPASRPRATTPRTDEPDARVFDSAESLFREANAARRSGDSSVARALYLRLEHDFPASDEAHLAHVSLGNLLLAMGRASEADRQFASYLGGRPALAQEALVGRAHSLAALGRATEEQRVWEGLLHDYPSSVYAGRAKQRLAELARPE